MPGPVGTAVGAASVCVKLSIGDQLRPVEFSSCACTFQYSVPCGRPV